MSSLNFTNVWQAIKRFFTATVDDKYPQVTPAQLVGLVSPATLPIAAIYPPPEPDEQFIVFENGIRIKGSEKALEYVDSIVSELDQKRSEMIGLQNDNQILQQELEKVKMDNAKLYQVLSTSKRILTEKLQADGIIEAKIPSYIHWFENLRDARVSPKQDLFTYYTCKNVVDLINIMDTIVAEEALKAAWHPPTTDVQSA